MKNQVKLCNYRPPGPWIHSLLLAKKIPMARGAASPPLCTQVFYMAIITRCCTVIIFGCLLGLSWIEAFLPLLFVRLWPVKVTSLYTEKISPWLEGSFLAFLALVTR